MRSGTAGKVVCSAGGTVVIAPGVGDLDDPDPVEPDDLDEGVWMGPLAEPCGVGSGAFDGLDPPADTGPEL